MNGRRARERRRREKDKRELLEELGVEPLTLPMPAGEARPVPMISEHPEFKMPTARPGMGVLAHRTIGGADVLLKVLNANRDLLAGLRRRAHFHKPGGRPARGIDWLAVFLCFLMHPEPALRTWWNEHTDDDFWARMGHDPQTNQSGKPEYWTVWENLTRKLARRADAFTDLHSVLLQRLVALDPEIGVAGMSDATEEQTWARLVHACAEGECPSERAGDTLGKFAAAPRHKIRAPQITAISPAEAAQQRADLIENGESPIGSQHAVGDGAHLVSGDIEHAYLVRIKRRDRLIFKTGKGANDRGGHWYMTCDPGAGVRNHQWQGLSQKAMHGRMNHKIVCPHSKLVLAVDSYSCTEEEADHIVELVARAEQATGRPMDVVMTDKGGSVDKVTAPLSRYGKAHVTPRRRHQTYGDRWDKIDVDSDDVWRCKHCGGETDRIGWLRNDGDPFLRVRCHDRPFPECDGVQQHNCDNDWQRTRRLPPTDDTYLAYSVIHMSHEDQHWRQRRRARMAPKTKDTVPRIIGDPWVNLVNQAAMAVNTLRYATRLGLVVVPTATYSRDQIIPINLPRPKRYDPLVVEERARIAGLRFRDGLHRPYGRPLSEQLGGHRDPPCVRVRAGPAAA